MPLWEKNGRRGLRWAAGSVRVLGVAIVVLLTLTSSSGAVDEAEEWYLRGRGPYRGRVIDAHTRQPIVGAVVLAIWEYDSLFTRGTRFHDALEVLTDAQGIFVMDAPEIERRAPRRTHFPIFMIFKPGYSHYRGVFADSEVLAERHRRPLLAVVELTPDPGQGPFARFRPPDVPFDVPPEKIPHFVKAVEEALDARRRGPPSPNIPSYAPPGTTPFPRN